MRLPKFLILPMAMLICSSCEKSVDYTVLASKAVAEDSAWHAVAEQLAANHNAEIFYYNESPSENLETLQQTKPRYVAVVEMPENLDRDFVIALHQLSRKVDEDIYADFLWGIITGYDAEGAMKMVNNSVEPLTIKSAVSTHTELKEAKWFDRYAWWDDLTPSVWGEKRGAGEEVIYSQDTPEDRAKNLTKKYAEIDPDLVTTSWHATERNLTLSFSPALFLPKDGKLYLKQGDEKWDLPESGKRKVYFAQGNCLIGNVNNTKESMAIAWMNGSNAAAMVGYVVTTWHGRNGWGGLKYWVTNSGRYTLAEALYMNQQDFLHQQHEWYPSLYEKTYDFRRGYANGAKRVAEAMGCDLKDVSKDMIGFWHDRDVLAYYGDPKWNVRLQEVEGEMDYSVKTTKQGGKYIVEITTHDNFNLERMKGDKFKQEHVLDLPFSYFFPERIMGAKLADGQQWKAAVDENFLIIYNADFKPSSTYKVILECK